MRALVQRVSRASVRFPDLPTPERAIGRGFLILLGCGKGDTPELADALAKKCAGLRLFPDEQGRFAKGLTDISGSALIVSQFTLYGNASRGRRPDFMEALPGPEAEPLYKRFAEVFAREGGPVQLGEFGAKMEVELVNDGPVTLWLDTAHL
ncbi:MAG: D-tyrosyl-tRNA(Tyr) deacylase [Elusimicrobia bacterium]|nr:D-tyrosyl-tRNA(Tyr) deacylase [Elusimicrobiota bacterium]